MGKMRTVEKTDNLPIFSIKLYEARRRKGLSQKEFGKLLNGEKSKGHQEVISLYERGLRQPSISVIIKMCDILDVDANFLFGFATNMKQRQLSEYSTDELVKELLKRWDVIK